LPIGRGGAATGGAAGAVDDVVPPGTPNTARGAPLEPLPGSNPNTIVLGDAVEVGLVNGRLTGDASRLLPAERSFVNEQLSAGRRVELIPTATGRTGDFVIDGVRYELKTVSNIVNTAPDRSSGSISSTIMSGRGQAPNIIVDARNQSGMTIAIAERAARRAFGADSRNGIQSITFLTPQGTIVIPRRPQ
jgi:hypothetical protein